MVEGLAGKRVIVTGASQGLGAVTARALAKEGARLVLFARSPDRLDEVRASCHEPDKHLAVAVDFMNRPDLEKSIHRAMSFLGGVDIVLHVAGGGLGIKQELFGCEDLWRLFQLNLGTAVEINRLVVPRMKEQRGGILVHIGSIASYEAVGSVGYNTVKAALAAYVRSLGRQLAPFRVFATGLLPGGFIADGNAMDRLSKNEPEAYQRFIAERLPRQEMPLADELIPMILLLCSGAAAMMAGCLVPMDAGEGKAYPYSFL